MKFLKGALPNISIALSVSLLIVIYLDLRNPMMGFLSGAPFLTLVGCTAAASIATAIVLYASYRKEGKKKRGKKREAQMQEIPQE